MIKKLFTGKQIAVMKTNTAIKIARTRAIITQGKDEGQPPENIADSIFVNQTETEVVELGNLITKVNFVVAAYVDLGLKAKVEADLNSTILRGYGCALREEYNHPWFSEWCNYLNIWQTHEDVTSSVTDFEKIKVARPAGNRN